MKNEMQLQFSALSQNESFARVAVAAFVAQLDPTLDEITEIKTVVSEAVTNAIIHGYENQEDGMIYLRVKINGNVVEMEIRDEGVGIPNVDEAKQPLFTTKPELERSGMGFTIMENFTDEMIVESKPKEGTVVKLRKQLSKTEAPCN